jgi:hypothetical protein
MSWFYHDTSPVLTAAQIIALHFAPHTDLPPPIKTVAAITQPAACGGLPVLDCANQMGDAQDALTQAYTAADTDARRAIIIKAVKGSTTVAKGTDWRDAWEKAHGRLLMDRMPPEMAGNYARAKHYGEMTTVSSYYGLNVNASTMCSYDGHCTTYVTSNGR